MQKGNSFVLGRLTLVLASFSLDWSKKGVGTTVHGRPSDRVRKKMENHAEIFGNIMRKKVTIMRKKSQIMRKFPKLMKSFPLFFQRIKYMLTCYRAV